MTGSTLAFGMVVLYSIGALLLFVLWVILPFVVFRIRRESIEQTQLLRQLLTRLEQQPPADQ